MEAILNNRDRIKKDVESVYNDLEKLIDNKECYLSDVVRKIEEYHSKFKEDLDNLALLCGLLFHKYEYSPVRDKELFEKIYNLGIIIIDSKNIDFLQKFTKDRKNLNHFTNDRRVFEQLYQFLFYCVVMYHDIYTVQYAVENGWADATDTNLNILTEAAIQNSWEFAKVLIDAGANYNFCNLLTKSTAIGIFSRHGNLEAVKYMAKLPNIDVNTHNVWAVAGSDEVRDFAKTLPGIDLTKSPENKRKHSCWGLSIDSSNASITFHREKWRIKHSKYYKLSLFT